MRSQAKQPRANRTITVDFQNEATYFQLLGDGKAFLEFVFAFLLSLGFQLTQGDLSRRRVPDAAFALCAYPSGWGDHLADTVYDVQSGIHGPPPLRPPLSSDATRGGPRCPVSDAWRAQFGTVRRPLPYLSHGALSPRLCVWSPESGPGAHPVWVANLAKGSWLFRAFGEAGLDHFTGTLP